MARVQRRARAARLAGAPVPARPGRVRFYGSVVPADSFREDLIAGLSQPQKQLPPKYFYDAAGSRLFGRICRLPEYYPTRTERAMLSALASGIAERTQACELVELGSGSGLKTPLLLDAVARRGALRRYVPFDFSEGTVRRLAAELVDEYPGLRVEARVGDFVEQLDGLPESEFPRLVVFLGGTLGNFRPAEACAFLSALAADAWPPALAELGRGVATRKIRYRETIAEGLAAAPEAFIGLLAGRNFGKQLVKLA